MAVLILYFYFEAFILHLLIRTHSFPPQYKCAFVTLHPILVIRLSKSVLILQSGVFSPECVIIMSGNKNTHFTLRLQYRYRDVLSLNHKYITI